MIEWGNAGAEVFLAFGSGCAAGYGFALRTEIRRANTRLEELKEENMLLKTKVDELQEKVMDMGTAFWPEHDRRKARKE